MKKILGIIIVAVLFCGIQPAYSAVNPILLEAQDFEAKGDIEQAKTLYLELYLAEKTDNYFYKLITLYTGTEDYEGLSALTLSKLKDQPDHTEAKRYLSRAYYGLGENDKGYDILLGIIDGDWNNLEKIRIAVNELLVRNEYNEAIKIYNTAREIIGEPDLFAIDTARLHVYREDYITAIEEYLKALDVSTSVYSDIKSVIESAINAEIEIEVMSILFEDYLKNNPDSINAARLLSELLYQARDFDKAYRVLIELAVKTDSAQDVLSMANTFKIQGHIENALEAYRDYYEFFKNAPNRVEALKSAASLEREFGNKERAVSDYQTIIDNHSGTIHAAEAGLRLIELSSDRTSLEGYTRILGEYAETTEFREVSFEAYYVLADAFLRNGMTDEAGTALASAILKARSSDERYKIYMKTAYLRFYENDFEMMSDAIQSCMGNLPDGEDINDILTFKILGLRCSAENDKAAYEAFSMGHFALYRGDKNVARENFSVASADTSSVVAPFALSALGMIARSEGNFTQAADYYLYAAESAQDTTLHVGALVEAADIISTELNDKERAKTLYLETLTLFPGTIFDHELRNNLRILAE
ncbi:tetratricopeptide repeat protein [Candidatus Latescibacterota bacterium]